MNSVMQKRALATREAREALLDHRFASRSLPVGFVDEKAKI
jgi:hypothetical protein